MVKLYRFLQIFMPKYQVEEGVQTRFRFSAKSVQNLNYENVFPV